MRTMHRILVSGPVPRGLLALMLVFVTGCAHEPLPPAHAAPVENLLHDGYFAPSTVAIDEVQVFALSDAMRSFADARLSTHAIGRNLDPRHALLEALYTKGQLQLRYDAGDTRTAAQAFEARAGNCLSLVIMTAAFSKHLGLAVSYQRVETEPSYSLNGALIFANGHVNLVLGPALPTARSSWPLPSEMTVDFLPPHELGARRTERVSERTVVAMFDNNRAAEALADGHLDDSYAWTRAALLQDPDFATAVNTLAVLYLHTGHPDAAETALRHVLEQEPRNTSALSNLVTALRQQGRDGDAQVIATRLAQLQPVTPFQAFDLGRRAMAEGDYGRARKLFARELVLQPEQPDVNFWAALADWRLGDNAAAAEHLRLARDNSVTDRTHALYAAKLAHLRALQLQ